jgi:hypothetical protein
MAQLLTELRKSFGQRMIVNELPLSPRINQACLAQYFQVMGNGWSADTLKRANIAAVHFIGLRDCRINLQPGFVGEGFRDLGDLLEFHGSSMNTLSCFDARELHVVSFE